MLRYRYHLYNDHYLLKSKKKHKTLVCIIMCSCDNITQSHSLSAFIFCTHHIHIRVSGVGVGVTGMGGVENGKKEHEGYILSLLPSIPSHL